MLDEKLQRARPLVVRQPRLQTLSVMDEQLDELLGISRVILSSRRGESFAESGERLRVDGVEDEEVVLQERVNERAAPLLKADGDSLAGVAPAQGGGPLVEFLRRVLDDGGLALPRSAVEEADIVFSIGPVDADQSSVFEHKPSRGIELC